MLFADVVGFTPLSEERDPEHVKNLLDRCFERLAADVTAYGGRVDKIVGDEIMAVFGAPVEMEDHADRALAAARDKLKELDKFNQWLRAEYGFDKSFRMGIGLNTGRVMSGNVGSEQRMAYTAIGDTTNTAARLEGMTKGTPHQLLFAESTADLLSGDKRGAFFVDEFEVRGREQKIRLWSVPEPEAQASPASEAAGAAQPPAG